MEFTTVEANDVSLSVRVFRPTAEVPPRPFTLVLTHQYSVLGGCQGLLKGMANQLAAKGFTTITFDMRGAGRSTGRPSITGSAEVQDVIAVCKWASEHIPAQSILLIGNSAGDFFHHLTWTDATCHRSIVFVSSICFPLYFSQTPSFPCSGIRFVSSIWYWNVCLGLIKHICIAVSYSGSCCLYIYVLYYLLWMAVKFQTVCTVLLSAYYISFWGQLGLSLLMSRRRVRLELLDGGQLPLWTLEMTPAYGYHLVINILQGIDEIPPVWPGALKYVILVGMKPLFSDISCFELSWVVPGVCYVFAQTTGWFLFVISSFLVMARSLFLSIFWRVSSCYVLKLVSVFFSCACP